MHLLERISINNWYLIDDAQDFEIRGATGVIGPTGTGKSSILDAIQTVLSGNNLHFLELNASAEGRSDRKVRDYCLAAIDDLGRNLRPRCETTLVLTFRDEETGMPIAVGLLLYADEAEPRERVVARFIVKNFSFRMKNFVEKGADGENYLLSHAEILERLKARKGFELYNVTAQSFVEAYLQAMRRRGAMPNHRHFLLNFSNMIAFRPVPDATSFVRKYVLPPDRLNVERIRESIDHWRSMETAVQRLEAMLAAVRAAKARFRTWGSQKVALNTRSFLQAHAERQRLEIEHGLESAKLEETRGELEKAQATKANHDRAIAELQTEINAKRSLIAESGVGAKLEAIDSRAREARREQDEAARLLAKRVGLAAELARLDAVRDHIPISLHPAIADADALAQAARLSPDELQRREEELDQLDGRARSLARASESLAAQNDDLAAEIRAKAERIAELESQLEDAGDTGAVLAPHVRRFRDLLKHAGIAAEALPDLVEVTDERWAKALEGLLGANREALLVAPHHQEKAHQILFENRRELYGCRLIQTRRMDRVDPRAEPGSIATIVRTDHPHIRKFIDFHAGRFRMVETEADLDRHDHAIMANGKTSGGLTLRVQRDLTPILGRTARTRALEAAWQELERLEQERSDLVKTKQRIASAIETLYRLQQDETPPISECLRRIAVAKAAIASAETDRRSVEDEETAGLRTEIEELAASMAAYNQELNEEILPQIKDLEQQERALAIRVGGLADKIAERRENEEEAEGREGEMQTLIALLDEPETIPLARERLEVEIFHHQGKERAFLAEIRNKAAEDAKGLMRTVDENGRRAVSGYAEFVKNYVGENPLPPEADNTAMLGWLIKREHDIESNELRPYRDLVSQARREMEAALKEDLLAKLNDKFDALKSQIKVLNARLDRHRFTGMRYRFTYAIDPRLSKLQALAERIAGNPQQGYAALSQEGGAEVAAAMTQIEEILDRSQDTSLLEDYRNYYTFELMMDTEAGVTTDFSRRSKVGSGGQKQAPYYVAIAAAMASVYYPGSRGKSAEGMGLVLFDEGFNRLDPPNTKAILAFYRELNLQIIVAAPPEKRLTFLESMDTMISVNRRDLAEEVYIDVEHVSEFARARMREENPEYLGIDAFRETAAASTQSAPTPREAAE